MVYEELKNKFEDLSDEDKNALLIYKSREVISWLVKVRKRKKEADK